MQGLHVPHASSLHALQTQLFASACKWVQIMLADQACQTYHQALEDVEGSAALPRWHETAISLH